MGVRRDPMGLERPKVLSYESSIWARHGTGEQQKCVCVWCVEPDLALSTSVLLTNPQSFPTRLHQVLFLCLFQTLDHINSINPYNLPQEGSYSILQMSSLKHGGDDLLKVRSDHRAFSTPLPCTRKAVTH